MTLGSGLVVDQRHSFGQESLSLVIIDLHQTERGPQRAENSPLHTHVRHKTQIVSGDLAVRYFLQLVDPPRLVIILPTAALLLILSYSLDLRPPDHLYRYIGRPKPIKDLDPYQAAEVQEEPVQTSFTLPNQSQTAPRTAQDRLGDAAKVVQLKEEILARHKDEEEKYVI